MPGDPITLNISSPSGGVVRAIAAEEQPPGTTPFSLNYVPYDLLGRKRVAPRFGTSLLYALPDATLSASGTFVQGMIPVGFILAPGAQIPGGTSTVTFSDFTPPFPQIDPTNGFAYVSTNANPPPSVLPAPAGQILDISFSAIYTGGVYTPGSGGSGQQFSQLEMIIPLVQSAAQGGNTFHLNLIWTATAAVGPGAADFNVLGVGSISFAFDNVLDAGSTATSTMSVAISSNASVGTVVGIAVNGGSQTVQSGGIPFYAFTSFGPISTSTNYTATASGGEVLTAPSVMEVG
jgi:hypothetical protein